MNEQTIQAITNAAMGIMFVLMAYEYLRLHIRMAASTSRLGDAMKRKYIAGTVAFVILAVTQVYSTWFNITASVGLFTYPVRTSLRVMAVVAMVALVYWARRMRDELDREDAEAMDGNEQDSVHEMRHTAGHDHET